MLIKLYALVELEVEVPEGEAATIQEAQEWAVSNAELLNDLSSWNILTVDTLDEKYNEVTEHFRGS